ncbi:MAG TPA: hypothetical protein VH394_19515 [Thermoanaerobaculia bacterium]|jgi:hypothetical protein|nr:hypothetical protein [Thermoanaerobaculia bacterium]
MKSFRIPAALFVIATGLCAGSASAQSSIITAKDVITLNQVAGQPTPVDVFLDDSQPKPNQPYAVMAGSAEKAVKHSWQVNALCGLRLKSLSVKQADGATYTPSLTPATKSWQKEESFATFPVAAIRQLCLDIANGSSVSVTQGLIAQHELTIQQNAFKNGGVGTAWVNGKLLLSGQCTNADGSKVITNVSNKEFPAQIQIRCCLTCG